MILNKKVSKMLRIVFSLIKKICFMIQIHEFLQSLQRRRRWGGKGGMCPPKFWNISYRISANSFLPWIVSAHLCTVTFGLMYCELWISTFKKEYFQRKLFAEIRNPIRTKGGRLCPPYYYWPPHLFGWCGLSDWLEPTCFFGFKRGNPNFF